jgi:hypothetical protein
VAGLFKYDASKVTSDASAARPRAPHALVTEGGQPTVSYDGNFMVSKRYTGDQCSGESKPATKSCNFLSIDFH